jgi:hypothetical protein
LSVLAVRLVPGRFFREKMPALVAGGGKIRRRSVGYIQAVKSCKVQMLKSV